MLLCSERYSVRPSRHVRRGRPGALLVAQGDGRIDADASKGRDERGDECRAEEQADGGAERGRIGCRHFEEKRVEQSAEGESADRAGHDTQAHEIGHADEQHARHRAKEHPEHALALAHDVVEEQPGADGTIGAAVRIRSDQTLCLEPVKSGVEGACLDPQGLGRALDVPGDGVTVSGP